VSLEVRLKWMDTKECPVCKDKLIHIYDGSKPSQYHCLKLDCSFNRSNELNERTQLLNSWEEFKTEYSFEKNIFYELKVVKVNRNWTTLGSLDLNNLEIRLQQDKISYTLARYDSEFQQIYIYKSTLIEHKEKFSLEQFKLIICDFISK